MHAIELVDVAGVLCLGVHGLLEDCPQASSDALVEFWTSSRCRLDAWGRALRDFSRPGASVDSTDFDSLVEEILLSQPHTRAMAAICVLNDARHGQRPESASVARNILAGHGEALRRLKPLLKRTANAKSHDHQLTASRARRWSDLLLGYLLPVCGAPGSKSPEGHVIEFAFDAERVVDFAYDAGAQAANTAAEVQRLLSASLRMSLSGLYTPAANPDLNHRIAGASLGLFGPEAFDDFGLLRSTWVRRLERSSKETLGMIDGLFDEKLKPITAAKRF